MTASTVTNNLEGGSNGATITGSNSGGAGNEGFDAATITGTDTLIFDNTHSRGTLAAKVTTGTSGIIRLGWTAARLSAVSEGWLRFYAYFTANPGVELQLANIVHGATNDGATLTLGGTGFLRVVDDNGTRQGQMGTPTPLNRWIRIEFHSLLSATNGVMDVWLYADPDAPIGMPTDHIHSTVGPTGAAGLTYDAWWMGAPQDIGSAQGPWWIDELGASTVGQLGPTAPALTTPATMGNFPGWYLGRLT